MVRHKPVLLSAVAPIALAAATILSAAPAYAQATTAAEQPRAFSIPVGRLAQSVLALSEQAGVQVVFDSDATGSVQGNAVNGRLAPSAALDQLLGGTGLRWRWLRAGVVTIEKVATIADGEKVTGVVGVEGATGSPYFGGAGVAAGVNGTNGSRDITATEGTKSFTSGALTVGSKVAQAMKDVPQSVSVLTEERMQQQNVTDYASALRQLPGITLEQKGDNLTNTFYSRGFEITNIQIDGGAPLSTNFNYNPQIDMSIYDHVELLRGAAGQFGAYGDPSGTINLVRKKPLDHQQFTVEAQAGSWSNYRVVADATAPLALDGRLRGRMVVTYQNNHHFYATAKDVKALIYGIAELDVTPTTLLTGGISYTKQDSLPWTNGLPRYLNGASLNLPRSTSFAFPWNSANFETTEIFGTLEQKIGTDWTLKVNLTNNRQTNSTKVGYSDGAVNPSNGLGPRIRGTYNQFSSKQFSGEATLTGSFKVFGQRQEVTIGANRVDNNGGGQIYYGDLIAGSSYAPYQPYVFGPVYCDPNTGTCPAGSFPLASPPINVFAFNPNDPLYTEPANPLAQIYFPENGQVQTGAYIHLRLTAFDRLHLTTGLRWSRYQYHYAFEYLCTYTDDDCTGKKIGDPETPLEAHRNSSSTFSWPPPVNLSFDVTKSLTVYGGYTDIYKDQSQYLAANKSPLPPVTGSNIEAGVKWAARGGKLNLALAAYRIQSQGFAIADPPNSPVQYLSDNVTCCYIANAHQTQESKGIDAEVTGEIRPGWQIAASYVFSENETKGSYYAAQGVEGLPFTSQQPKHLYKLWMSYDFGAAGHAGMLSGLTLSGGVNGQSEAYRSGSTCIRLSGTPDPITGAQGCAPNTDPANPSTVNFAYVVPAQVLLSARVDYRLSDKWSVGVNLENILDKTYYQTVSYVVSSGNWYGAPRSIVATLRGKW